MRVYLAGPIGGLNYSDTTDWREQATRLLHAHHSKIEGFSPMRGKQFLDTNQIIDASVTPYEHPLATSKGIMTRDFNDCKNADVILVNMGIDHPKLSLGTVMEIAFAYSLQIPVVMVDNSKFQYANHPMIKEAVGFLAKDLTEAVKITASILLPRRS